MITLEVDSSELEKNLQALISEMGSNAEEIIRSEVSDIMEESKEQVPKDTGTILATAYTEVESSGDEVQASFGYTGNAVNPKTGLSASDYDVAVHEDLTVNHVTGKAKFLEDPINDYAATAESSIGNKIRQVLGT